MEPINIKYNETKNHKTYIETKRQEIDNYLKNNEYSRAFGILFDLIERLNEDDKRKIWEYYENKIFSTPQNNNIIPTDPYFHSK